jgi:GT2 family glycosyltransferase
MQKDISFVIVNYNGLSHIQKLYASLIGQMAEKEISWEAVIVDNASMDKSPDLLKEIAFKDKRIRPVFLGQNYGFAKASNTGAEAAQGKYLVFLNPDTQLIDHNICDLISFYESRKEIGALGVKMLHANGSLQRSARSFPTLARQFYESFFLDKAFAGSRIFGAYFMRFSTLEEVMEVDWLSGAFLFISKELFGKAKGFDGDYFLFSEDTDLCLRLKRMGYTNYFYPYYRIIHDDGAISGRDMPRRSAQIIRARNIYFRKNYSLFSAKIVTLYCFAGILNRILVFGVMGIFRPKKGYFQRASQSMAIFREYFRP